MSSNVTAPDGTFIETDSTITCSSKLGAEFFVYENGTGEAPTSTYSMSLTDAVLFGIDDNSPSISTHVRSKSYFKVDMEEEEHNLCHTKLEVQFPSTDWTRNCQLPDVMMTFNGKDTNSSAMNATRESRCDAYEDEETEERVMRPRALLTLPPMSTITAHTYGVGASIKTRTEVPILCKLTREGDTIKEWMVNIPTKAGVGFDQVADPLGNVVIVFVPTKVGGICKIRSIEFRRLEAVIPTLALQLTQERRNILRKQVETQKDKMCEAYESFIQQLISHKEELKSGTIANIINKSTAEILHAPLAIKSILESTEKSEDKTPEKGQEKDSERRPEKRKRAAKYADKPKEKEKEKEKKRDDSDDELFDLTESDHESDIDERAWANDYDEDELEDKEDKDVSLDLSRSKKQKQGPSPKGKAGSTRPPPLTYRSKP